MEGRSRGTQQPAPKGRGREARTLYGMYVADARAVQSPDKAQSNVPSDLVESHLFYVIQVAKEYRSLGIPLEDLLAEGNLGLIEASRRYDRARGVKFISYATWWIRKRMWDLAMRQVSLVRLPKYKQERLRRVRAAERELRNQLGRDPLAQEVSTACGLGLAEIASLQSQSQREIPLDTIINADSGLRLEEVVAERNAIQPDASILAAGASASLAAYLEHLPSRQRAILAMHFGLEGKRPSTLAEIGRRLGVSRERVRQLERQGLARLKRLLEVDGYTAAAC